MYLGQIWEGREGEVSLFFSFSWRISYELGSILSIMGGWGETVFS